MNKEIIRKWVDALRSGNFKQTKGQLGRVASDGSRSYCCLGVLCELAVADGVIDPPSRTDIDELKYDGDWAVPPKTVDEWLGQKSGTDYSVSTPDDLIERNYDLEFERYKPYDDMIELTSLNDEESFTFEQIADAIERTYLS